MSGSNQLDLDSEPDLGWTDEFDSVFISMNPGIVKAQKFFKRNQQEIVSQIESDFQHMPDIKAPEEIYVNLPIRNLHQEQGFGLNKNRRGAITEQQLQDIQRAKINYQENINFGKQPFKIV